MGCSLASLVATVALFAISKEDFIPSVDTGQIQVSTEAADRVSFDAMGRMQRQMAEIAQRDPNVAVRDVLGGLRRRPAHRHQYRHDAAQAQGLGRTQACRRTRSSRNCDPSCRACRVSTPICRIRHPSASAAILPSRLTNIRLQDTNQDELDSSALKLMNVLSHAPRLCRCHHRHGPDQPDGECRYRPRPGCGPGRVGPVDRDGAGRLLRRRADFHALCQRRRILGDAGIAAAIPERCFVDQPALCLVQQLGGSGTSDRVPAP